MLVSELTDEKIRQIVAEDMAMLKRGDFPTVYLEENDGADWSDPDFLADGEKNFRFWSQAIPFTDEKQSLNSIELIQGLDGLADDQIIERLQGFGHNELIRLAAECDVLGKQNLGNQIQSLFDRIIQANFTSTQLTTGVVPSHK